MKTIDNWMIIELSTFVINGELNNRNFYSDKLILIKDGYAVTQQSIYKLGKIDKIWSNTEQARYYVEKFS